jgi:hypothetical protein
MTTMTARYPGTCADTGRRFQAGATIDYDRATKRARLLDQPAADPAATEAGTYDMEKFGHYLALRTVGRTSNVFTTSGGTFYRNKRGRCEDAPCCGCCTI